MVSKANLSFKSLIAVIALLMLLPLYVSLHDVFNAKNGLSSLLQTRGLGATLGRSLLLAFCTGIGGALIAVPQAFFLARYRLPGKKLWVILFVLPLVVPSYISAYSYLAAFGPKGFFEQLFSMPFPIAVSGNLFGTWLSMTLVNCPFIFLMTYAALLRQSSSIEESAIMLGCSPKKVFFRVTLPNLKIPIASGTLLVCLYTLSDFGTPAILNYKTLTFHIFQYIDLGRFDRASFFALILIFVAFLFLLAESFINRRRNSVLDNKTKSSPIIHSTTGLQKTFILSFFFLTCFVSLIVPFATIIYWFLQGTSQFNLSKDLSQVSGNSLLLALLTALIATLFALPVAWAAIRQKGLFSKFADRVSFVGNMFPGLVVALAFVSFFASFKIFGFSLYQTLTLPVLACTIRFLPQAVSSIKTSLAQLNPKLEEASLLLGNNKRQTARQIIEPLIRPGLLSGFALVFISTLKELPITLVLAQPGKGYLTQRIWDLVDEAEYSRVAAPALLLLGISCISLYFILTKEKSLNDE